MSAELKAAAEAAQKAMNGCRDNLLQRQGELEAQLKAATGAAKERIRAKLKETRLLLRRVRHRTVVQVRALVGTTLKAATVTNLIAGLAQATVALKAEQTNIANTAKALDGFSSALTAFNTVIGQLKKLSATKDA